MNLKTRTTMSVKVSVFLICDEWMIYLLLVLFYNLQDCTIKNIFHTAEHCNEKELGSEIFMIYEECFYISFPVVTFSQEMYISLQKM